ncbi:MAG: hypothetical protein ABH868_05470 [bacterium]
MKIKMPKSLQDIEGMISLMVAFLVVIIICIFSYMIVFIVKVNMKSGLHHKLASRAIETADVGVAQMISDIHRHTIDITSLPATTSYAVIKYPDSGATETVTVTLDTIPDIDDVDGDGDTAEPETDIAGHIVYKIDSVSKATLATGQEILKRQVSARLSIVNLASYNLFYVENDIWANFSTPTNGVPIMLDGPYHTNGNLELGAMIYFNNQYLPANPGSNNVPGITLNPSYVNDYTVMSAGNILQAGGYPSNITYTQHNERGRLSSDSLFSTCANSNHPRGTWFDKARGGFEIHLEPLDFVHYRALAHVRIDINELPFFSVFGSSYASNDLVIVTGAGFNAVEIDLSFLGTGSSKDICGGYTNYNTALSSEYGLVIFVKGPVAVHGKLADVAGAANTNKKVTIISTGTVDIIGDILYSGDPYMQVLDSFNIDIDGNDKVDGWSSDVPALGRHSMEGTPFGWPFKNLAPEKSMVVEIKKAATDTITYSKHFNIVAPPAGIDNSKAYVNVRSSTTADASAGVTMTLELEGQSSNIWSTGPVPVNSTDWQRLVVVDDASFGTTLSLADIQDINNNAGDNVKLIFTTPDNQWRQFYVDELCFAFGKSYPVDYATVNPTDDSIALISQGNIYENPWYLYTIPGGQPWYYNWLNVGWNPYPEALPESIRYFAVNGDYAVNNVISGYPSIYYDLRMDAFMYTGLTGSMFTVHTNRWLNMFTVYGAMTSHRGGVVRAPVFNNVYDRDEVSNVSTIIPMGTVLHTYQQVK